MCVLRVFAHESISYRCTECKGLFPISLEEDKSEESVNQLIAELKFVVGL